MCDVLFNCLDYLYFSLVCVISHLFIYFLGAQLKTTHNLRLLCTDVLDLCRHKSNKIGLVFVLFWLVPKNINYIKNGSITYLHFALINFLKAILHVFFI